MYKHLYLTPQEALRVNSKVQATNKLKRIVLHWDSHMVHMRTLLRENSEFCVLNYTVHKINTCTRRRLLADNCKQQLLFLHT